MNDLCSTAYSQPTQLLYESKDECARLREEVQTLQQKLDAEKETVAKLGKRASQLQSRALSVEQELKKVKSESSRRASRLKELLQSELLSS